ncbi:MULTISPECIES: lactate racemase domain-containing protein [Acidithrix]|uniref:LarA-like N-terminal domain-containing protein n=3 Tax=root TaxID=1 RepID=A0A0D8HJ30_9ACTN|nr:MULTISPECIES: lactate racemase domain-containing protein [Acidithrix]KJF17101.1 hypothetical protein AXFE_20140 [Acidithrix ferrooxidans]CAG4925752.1 unnamed protein product [Acidithrix sp. C25]
MSPRPGFILNVDKSYPGTLFWHGEGYRIEKLPEGSSVIYAPESLPSLSDPLGAIEDALDNPVGDSDPLDTLLTSGMRLTIAFDDVSLPLPQMVSPDIRSLIIEAVLERAARAGVEDVVLIAALALHRRMTESELRHAVGDRVYDSFYPRGLLLQHDAEDPKGLSFIGLTPQGEEVEISKRAAESDLIVYVNVNLVSMDGGHKSVATGLSSYRSLRHHHNVKTMVHSKSFMDRHNSQLHSSNWRMGAVIKEAGIKIFQIETTLNNDTFPKQFEFLQKREWEWNLKDRAKFITTSKALEATPPWMARNIFHSIRSPYGLTGVNAGEVDAVHEKTLERVYKQQLVHVSGQSDILTMGLPFIGPYNVNSIMNPILVYCLGLGYFFNMYKNKPLVRKGGVLIMSHPTRNEFDPVFHPSYIDFYENVLSETTDPIEIEAKYEKSYAEDPWYIHLYRTGNAYHGVHPFYMWYWGAHALDHLGAVIILGGDPKVAKRLGFMAASTLNDALAMASAYVGTSPSITHLHSPPLLMAQVE